MGVVFGRSGELALVEDCLGAGEPCALVGESGIGKTTLARTAAGGFEPALVGGGLPTLSWVPYVPLWLALGQKLPSGDDAHVADEVARRVGDGLLVVDDLQWA
ncbi:MAG TPA: ATP-binding protein, partial [Gaiellaceae bacterium]